jgi:hypothetical protein
MNEKTEFGRAITNKARIRKSIKKLLIDVRNGALITSTLYKIMRYIK